MAATLEGVLVNDIHSKLNRTAVDALRRPRAVEDLRAIVRAARDSGSKISIAGGRHAMGGQQFGERTVLIDMAAMDRVLSFDAGAGLVTVEAGIMWPALVRSLIDRQAGRMLQWGIVQKQTGADRLTMGGALAANIHGRGLTLAPFVDDVESFTIVDGEGRLLTCSRNENHRLFTLALGGYGLFGVVATVTLRLRPRRKVVRRVALFSTDRLVQRLDRRIAEGYEFGDFQFAIDPSSPGFLNVGICSCYRPVAGEDDVEVPEGQRVLSERDWEVLVRLAHEDKRRAFDHYARHYLATDGQIYWSDTHQLAEYVDDYHAVLDRHSNRPPASEMIGEVYVPRAALDSFFQDVRDDFRRGLVDVIYGTVRLIERDAETFLAWARNPWACIVFNLHVEHTPQGIAKGADDFRRLIDHARRYGGSYYLTYHRWARRDQVEACYPQIREFLRLKREFDPDERFESDWYRHHREMFA
jgi:FAD/FMN-containing dehydrogenase